MGGGAIAEAVKAEVMTGQKQDWSRIAAELDEQGWAVLPGLLAVGDCEKVAALYDQSEVFRSRVVMARHGFGRGEYRYFAYPLPSTVQTLRTSLYPRLAPIANIICRDRLFHGDSVDFCNSRAIILCTLNAKLP